MVKARLIYVCSSCDGTSSKWLGKCPSCSEWNTLVEEKGSAGARKGLVVLSGKSVPVSISELKGSNEERVTTGIGEVDRVLGGGIVHGSAVLIGGEPGIGKSTLLLQVASNLAELGTRVLYVTGEESARQIRIRGERLGLLPEELFVYPETCIERVLEASAQLKPGIVIIDSIQTVFTETVESAPGSVSQVRESAALLIANSRVKDIPLFLVGHVTKDGALAGPRVLEHMVDTVLYFEGEQSHQFRVLRAVKNRYGSSMELGVFEMKDKGLAEVGDPSRVFLADRPIGSSGSVITSSIEGTRSLLVEIQALVSPTPFGVPRRTVVGVDYNRTLLLCAVLEKRVGIGLAGSDIYIKVAGGLKLNEPAVDLAVVSAMVSNHLDKPIDAKTVAFGEVGLAGEVRAVNRAMLRLKEAKRLGFTRAVMPKDNIKECRGVKGIKAVGVSLLSDAVDSLFEL